MLFNEFGKKENPAILLLHGMIQDWRSLWEPLKSLEEKYRVIVPAMTGMYGNSPDFTNFPDQARRIEEFIIEHYDGKLRGVYGLSQGVAVLSELLANNNVKIDVAVWDGGYLAEAQYPKILLPIVAFVSIRMYGRLIKNRRPSKIMLNLFKRAGMDEKDFAMLDSLYKDISRKSFKRNLYENYTYKANPNIKNSDTLVYLWCGSKESYAIKSHEILKKYLKTYEEEFFADMGHGHLLLYHADELCKRLGDIF